MQKKRINKGKINLSEFVSTAAYTKFIIKNGNHYYFINMS